jgi:hypothetical protein
MTDRTILAMAVGIVGLLVTIVVIAGAIVLIVNPDDLKFGTYITDLTIMASAIGAAIGAALYRWRGGTVTPAAPAPSTVTVPPKPVPPAV